MSFISLIILGAAIVSIGIGYRVLFESRRNPVNQAFFLFSIGTALWIGGYGMIIATHNDVYLPILNGGGLLLVIGLTYFAQLFPTPTPIPFSRWLFWLPLIAGGALLLLSNKIVLGVSFSLDGTMNVTHGPLAPVWSLLLLLYILISVGFFIRSYIYATARNRALLWFIYTGISLFVITSILFDAVLPSFFGFTQLSDLGPLTSLFFLFATSLAITKHRFLNIRVVLQRSLVYSVCTFILTCIYVLLLISIEEVYKGVSNMAAPLSAGITILISMYTLPRMESYFRRISDPYFFKDRYDYFSVLDSLSESLNRNLNLRPLVLQSLTVLEKAFKPEFAYFIRTETSTCYSHLNYSDLNERMLVTEDCVEIHIRSDSRMIGTYILGPRRSGDSYGEIDHSLMKTFASHARVSFEKAELYQKLRDHKENLEVRVDERTKHLHELQIRQREFFDDISHALQTPLTVVRGGLELLKKNLHSGDIRTHTIVNTSVEDLSRLISSILQLARIESYSSESQMSLVDLTSIILRTSEYVRIIAEASDISLSLEIDSLPLFIRGDEKQIEEMCTNLLSNAVKYTSKSKIRRISISLLLHDGNAILCITDTGIGMTHNQLEKVFDRFYRASETKPIKEGFGLGLAITKRIIERHNGNIRYSSTFGEGTTVTVSLPAELPVNPHAQTPL